MDKYLISISFRLWMYFNNDQFPMNCFKLSIIFFCIQMMKHPLVHCLFHYLFSEFLPIYNNQFKYYIDISTVYCNITKAKAKQRKRCFDRYLLRFVLAYTHFNLKKKKIFNKKKIFQSLYCIQFIITAIRKLMKQLHYVRQNWYCEGQQLQQNQLRFRYS